MPEASLFLKLAETLGVCVIIFIMWYFYRKDQTEIFKKQMENQEVRFAQIIQTMTDSSNKSYELLKEMLETSQLQGGKIIQIEEHLRTNQYCPLVRRKGTSQNELRNLST